MARNPADIKRGQPGNAGQFANDSSRRAETAEPEELQPLIEGTDMPAVTQHGMNEWGENLVSLIEERTGSTNIEVRQEGVGFALYADGQPSPEAEAALDEHVESLYGTHRGMALGAIQFHQRVQAENQTDATDTTEPVEAKPTTESLGLTPEQSTDIDELSSDIAYYRGDVSPEARDSARDGIHRVIENSRKTDGKTSRLDFDALHDEYYEAEDTYEDIMGAVRGGYEPKSRLDEARDIYFEAKKRHDRANIEEYIQSQGRQRGILIDDRTRESIADAVENLGAGVQGSCAQNIIDVIEHDRRIRSTN